MTTTQSLVQQVRESEGVSRAALARECGLSEKTLKRAEDGAEVSPATRGKIVKGLNRLPDRLATYTIDDLFPTRRDRD